MIIWGWRRYAQTIAMITFVCGHCGNPAAQTLRKLVTKFTLFYRSTALTCGGAC